MPDERTDPEPQDAGDRSPEESQDGLGQMTPGTALALPSQTVFQSEAAPDPDSEIEDLMERLKQRSGQSGEPSRQSVDPSAGQDPQERAATEAPSAQEKTASTPGQSPPAEEAKRQAADYLGLLSDREPRPAHEHAPATSLPATFPSDTVKIGLWGSPSSGKTTFLAALRSACIDPYGRDANAANGTWNLIPGDDVSEEFMVQLIDTLISGEFPEKTQIDVSRDLLWLFKGSLTDSRYGDRDGRLRRLPTSPGSRLSEFVLDLVDVSGEAFAPRSKVPQNIKNRALDHLARATGLLYLFDPLKEREDRNSYEYFTNTIVHLSRRMAAAGKLVGPHLPHELSVCITKFDDQEVFQSARRAGLVDLGRDGSPRVYGEHAERYFEKLCDGSFWPDRKYERNPGGAPFIRAEIRKQFHPDRIRYFVTSSVGFRRRGQGRTFDPDDFANVLPRESTESGGPKFSIIDPVDPINVLEPLISLHQRISGHGNNYG